MHTTHRFKTVATALFGTWALFVASHGGERVAQADCYKLQGPTTPGWKRVTLPAGASALAATGDVPQLRADDAVWLTEPWRFAETVRDGHLPGSTDYLFAVSPAEHGRFELYFAEPLRGAKVDVWANTTAGMLWLWHEQRVADDQLQVAWDSARVQSITVRVHHHARREPPVQRYRLTRQTRLADEGGIAAAFRQGRSLYLYLGEGEQPSLCNLPGRALTVPLELLLQGGTPTAIAVTPER